MARGLKMTTLTQLIEHYCPDSVECVKLGDVAIRQRGIAITAAKMRELDSPNGGIVVFGAGATRALIDSSEIASTNIHTKDSVIVKARGHVGFEMCTVPFTTKSELWSYRSDDPKLNIRYGYYFLSEHSGELAEIARLNGVKLPQLKVSDTDNYLIPLPPREVQDAIVERLDAFAALIESLDSEIALREKRFEYFREQLLTFDESDDVELKEVLKYEQPGKYLVSSTDYDDGFSTAVLTAGKTFILGYTDETTGIYEASPDDPVIIFDDFTTAFKWVDFPFKAKSSAMKMLTPAVVDSSFRYIFYAMHDVNVDVTDHKRQWIRTYSKEKIPLPPLDVQQDIAEKLDTMQALIDNLKHERELRKTQFEYYREKLLTFNS